MNKGLCTVALVTAALTPAGAESVKRTRFVDPQTKWLEDTAQSVYAIRDTLEFKTTWHPIGA